MARGSWRKGQSANSVQVSKYKKEYLARRLHVGLNALNGLSEREAAKLSGFTKDQVRYWKKKLMDPSYHNGGHGGRRDWKLSRTVKILIYCLARLWPRTTLNEIVVAVKMLSGDTVTPACICKLFQSWGWSYRMVEQKQSLKYTSSNIQCYFNHLIGMLGIVQQYGPKSVKYLGKKKSSSLQSSWCGRVILNDLNDHP